MPRVQLPDGRVIEFPDGMSEAQMAEAIKSLPSPAETSDVSDPRQQRRDEFMNHPTRNPCWVARSPADWLGHFRLPWDGL